jgi:hypothetical protein
LLGIGAAAVTWMTLVAGIFALARGAITLARRRLILPWLVRRPLSWQQWGWAQVLTGLFVILETVPHLGGVPAGWQMAISIAGIAPTAGFMMLKLSSASGGRIFLGVLPSRCEMQAGHTLWSLSRQYVLNMQSDGDLVLYRDAAGQRTELWSARTSGAGNFAVMQGDGNLVVYSAAKWPLWNSSTAPSPGALLNMQDDGNAVIYSTAHEALFSTNTAGK